MRERRTSRRRGAAAEDAAGFAASIVARLWARAAERPVDSLAVAGAAVASLIIIVNAVFLQSSVHPAPFFTNPARLPSPAQSAANAGVTTLRPEDAAIPARLPAAAAPQPVSIRRNDPIADLIGASVGSRSRVMGVQRALSEFGYGQIKPSGVLDDATGAAISQFEREHKMPVTGRLSERLLSELATLVGHPLD